jgi:hypothetical protein
MNRRSNHHGNSNASELQRKTTKIYQQLPNISTTIHISGDCSQRRQNNFTVRMETEQLQDFRQRNTNEIIHLLSMALADLPK